MTDFLKTRLANKVCLADMLLFRHIFPLLISLALLIVPAQAAAPAEGAPAKPRDYFERPYFNAERYPPRVDPQTPKRQIIDQEYEVIETGLEPISTVGSGIGDVGEWLNDHLILLDALQDVPDANVKKLQRVMLFDTHTGKLKTLVPEGRIYCWNSELEIVSIAPLTYTRETEGHFFHLGKDGVISELVDVPDVNARMAGGAGDDTYVIDQEHEEAIELLYGGTDTVRSGISLTLQDQIERLVMTTGATWGWGNGLDNALTASDLGNSLGGGSGKDSVAGGAGSDVLDGGAGDDVVSDLNGGNLLRGGAGDDTIITGAGNNLIVGGAGTDTIRTGSGRNVIAYNRGDGADTLIGSAGSRNTISFGAGINVADLRLLRNGNDLRLDIGAGDVLQLKDWYLGADRHSVETLQFFMERGRNYNPGGERSNDSKVQTFDLERLAASTDELRLRHSNPHQAQTGPNLASVYPDAFITSSKTAALGGDLSWQYAMTGNFAGDLFSGVQATLSSPQFGVSAQALQKPRSGVVSGDFTLAS